MVKKVAIIGAGPSGLLLAHYLLKRDCQYRVDIYERRSDPRTKEITKSRTYPIALNDRGMNAISQVSGLKEAVAKISVEMQGTVVHTRNAGTRYIERKKPLVTLDRTELTKVFLNTLEQRSDRDRFNIHFQHSCVWVDLNNKQVRFSTPESESTVDYDLIVGSDGARSVVRKAFQDTKLFELEQKYISNDYKSLYLPSGEDKVSNTTLKSGNIHSWRLEDGTVVLLLHQSDGSMAGVIHFPRDNNQIVGLSSENKVKQFFLEQFPEVGQLMPESEVAAFLKRPVATTLTIRCNRYHYSNSALLIGDAAHAVSPSLGQGCNSALEDVTVLDRLLDEYTDDLSIVLKQFTRCRLADTHAVVELSNYTLPFNRSLFVQLIVRQRLAKLLHRFFPQKFLPPLFEALHESSIPYANILREYRGWCNKVKKSQQKFYEPVNAR